MKVLAKKGEWILAGALVLFKIIQLVPLHYCSSGMTTFTDEIPVACCREILKQAISIPLIKDFE